MAAEEPTSFVHLHLHSQYSLLDGGNRLDRLVQRIGELGMDAVAVTDHGNLFGAVEFYQRARAAGIKPILGIEAYVAPDLNGKPSDRRSREYTGVADGGFHLVLLAENQVGWRNLIKLSSDAYIHGFYFRPRMDKTTLARWSEGLIAINGHLGSSIAHWLVQYEQSKDPAHFRHAADEARWHAETFAANAEGAPCFFLEMQRHDEALQNAINPHVIRLSEELGLPLVADNDAHFLRAEDYDVHDTLCCISMGKTKQDSNRLHYPRQLFVKSADEMAQLFSDQPEAVANTARIAARCHVELELGVSHAPMVKIVEGERSAPPDPEPAIGSTAWYQSMCGRYELQPFDATKEQLSHAQLKQQCDDAMRGLCEAGLIWRYGAGGVTDEIRRRLDRELGILADKSISAYFLIVWDFVNEARRRGIPCGARGSGVGTMVGYVLGLSNACPVKYGLLFERFTDPDRYEYPDIDIDICQDGRQEILEYVREKYGHVAQIITFGTLKARAAIRDVGRVFDVPLPEVDKLCKLVGDALGTRLDQALQQEPELKKLYEENSLYRELIDTASKLEGMARHAGVHAAGVVIATQPLENIIPLYQPPGTDQLVTQWDGPTVEKVGLLKMDFLGLRTLSVIERSRQLIRQTLSPDTIARTVTAAPPRSEDGSETPTAGTSRVESGTQSATRDSRPEALDPLDLDRLTYGDPRVFELFARGETAGIFQFESGGMRDLLMQLKPDCLEDLIAANALYRPGPMELIPQFIHRKHGRDAVPEVHPIVDRLTEQTHGIMVYQEQVMQVASELGGIPLRQAYTLIKAISKKNKKIIDANRAQFMAGAQERGVSESLAAKLFDLILKFAGYGFNKSHSTGYAIVAYQTAYLKAYFPVQYMAALLTYESVSTEKVVEYIDACKRVSRNGKGRGIDVRPPDINLSDVAFTVVFATDEPHDAEHGHIRFGLSAVKGVGEKAMASVIAERQRHGPFRDLYDFCERVDLRAVNRATIEALIKCGAFDTLYDPEQRAALAEALDSAMQCGQQAAADRRSGQLSMFDAGDEADGASPAGTAGQHHDLPPAEPWSRRQQLDFEKEVLGLFVSSHPLDEYREVIERFGTCDVEGALTLPPDTSVIVGGMLTRVRRTVTRAKQEAMAMLTVESQTARIEAVAFPRAYEMAAPLLENDAILFFEGKIDHRREQPNIVVDKVYPVTDAPLHLTKTVKIVIEDSTGLEAGTALAESIGDLKQVLRQAANRGEHRHAAVMLELHQAGQVVCLRLNGLRVAADAHLAGQISSVLRRAPQGRARVELVGPDKVQLTASRTENSAPDPRPPALHFTAAAPHGEACASIDRY